MSTEMSTEMDTRFTYRQRTLAAAIAHIIRTQPERWNQEAWFGADTIHLSAYGACEANAGVGIHGCGTTACVAGWAVRLSDPVYIKSYGSFVHPATAAQRLLGLTDDEADWLFSSARTQDEVLWALDAMTEGRGW